MATWTPQKRDVLDAICDDFLHNYGKGRTLLAIDGAPGSGSREFADALAERLGKGSHAVFRASIDEFQRPRAERQVRGVDSAEGYYLDAFDYELFRRVLVEPFRLGGSAGFVTAAFDAARDVQIEMDWKTGPQDGTLVVDGPFLNRPELRGIWNYSIWLDVTPEESAARLFDQHGATGRSSRYAGAQALYDAEAHPRDRATAIVDNTDADSPRRLFADAC
ncbi:MAG: uridine kinase [Microbacteriaceae bacterium]|nr:uridine kinase [Microbacteriaceae bacterium]